MDEQALFTRFWTNEARTTSTVLARIPENSDYRPDPKSRTAREIAWQIVCEEKMIMEALERGSMAWSPEPMPGTMKEIVDTYAAVLFGMGRCFRSIHAQRRAIDLLYERPGEAKRKGFTSRLALFEKVCGERAAAAAANEEEGPPEQQGSE